MPTSNTSSYFGNTAEMFDISNACPLDNKIDENRDLRDGFGQIAYPDRITPHKPFAAREEIEPQRIGAELNGCSRILRRRQPADLDSKHYAAVAKPSAGLLKSGAGISFTSLTIPSCHLSLIVCR